MNVKGFAVFFASFVVFSLPLISISAMVLSSDQITSNDDFFVISKGGSPEIDIQEWELTIDGLVEQPKTFTFDSLLSTFETTSLTATLQCVEGPSGTALWEGILLIDILNQVGLKQNATEVVFHAADDYTTSLTLEEIAETEVLLAFNMNGEPIPVEQGYPMNLVVPDHLGYKWIKWLVRIEVIDYDHEGYWESRGWADDAKMSTISDWIFHAILFSLAFLVGGLSLITGLRFSSTIETFKVLPKFAGRKFHVISGISFAMLTIITFFYWIGATFVNRGAVFYTIHGILASITTFLVCGSAITGLFLKRGKKTLLKKHNLFSAYGFLFYLFTILLGFYLTFSNALRLW